VHFDSVSLDGVACVPLYPLRERERTYNQAALLADGLADRLGVPRAPGVLRRVRRTLSQTGFDAGARRQNVRGAFVAEHARWLDGRTILLVDDVMTTGATVCECARMLLQGGAHRVYVATVARG
jgi:ComF family protein